VGVVTQGNVHDEVLLEMLDHQGVAYRIINSEADHSAYPTVLLSRYSEGAYAMARKSCESESDILVAEKNLDLDGTLALLQGLSTDKRDDFDLAVNKEEDKLLSLIRANLFGQNLPLARKWYWPKMAPMACVLTHDIDWFEYSPFHKQVLKQSANPVRLARLGIGALIRGKDYGWNIPEMVKLEQGCGYRSTFFFQTSYGTQDHFLEESAKLLKGGAFELALHGAHSSHNDAAALSKELDTFRSRTGESSRGVRYHILKFETPKTWEIQSSAGLAYDATFFHNRFFGFRAGVCFPYHPLSNELRIPILELPTGYMDWTAFHRRQGAREQVETFEQSRMAVEAYHGVFVANFHNTYMNKETFPTMYDIFKSLLETSKAKGYWVATADECARWWNLRTAAQIDPRLESGKVVCSPAGVDVIVERDGKDSETIPAALRAVGRTH
jgi:hypothetical protein